VIGGEPLQETERRGRGTNNRGKFVMNARRSRRATLQSASERKAEQNVGAALEL
jgi:hypothetical protein